MRIVATMMLFRFLFSSVVVAEDARVTQDEILNFRYDVKHAPVWTADGKFDPTELVKLIEASIDAGPDCPKPLLRIRQRPKAGALTISTTVATHEQIWAVLKQFPALTATWRSEAPDFPELLKMQNRERRRNSKSNQVHRFL